MKMVYADAYESANGSNNRRAEAVSRRCAAITEPRLSNQRRPFISATRAATAAIREQPADLVLAPGTHGS